MLATERKQNNYWKQYLMTFCGVSLLIFAEERSRLNLKNKDGRQTRYKLALRIYSTYSTLSSSSFENV